MPFGKKDIDNISYSRESLGSIHEFLIITNFWRYENEVLASIIISNSESLSVFEEGGVSYT